MLLYIMLLIMKPPMKDDFLLSLGYLALGSRMKRLGERLQAETQIILDETGLILPAAQFPLLAALDANGPMTVGDLAAAIGVAQPGVTRTLAKLEAEGAVASKIGADDRRVRSVSLTAEGKRIVAHAKSAAWPLIEAAVAGACDNLKGPLLSQLGALEDALEAAPLSARVPRKRLRRHA